MSMLTTVQALLLTVLVLCATHARAGEALLVLEDPRGDDRGPGTYVAPSGAEYRRGDFDLRKLTVRVEKDHAIIEVLLGATVRRHHVGQRAFAGNLDLSNGIYVQNVDVYIDSTPGKGFTDGLPGRRIRFAAEEAWDVAITFTPQPGPTRTLLSQWNRDAAEKVITPVPVRSNGATVSARIPLWQLGGAPKATWGWSVAVSGASWEHSFSAVDRLRGQHEVNAFTLPVYGVAEERAFGGATISGAHPYVIDVLLPEGAKQSDVLGTFSASAPATLPMIYRERPKQLAVAKPTAVDTIARADRGSTANDTTVADRVPKEERTRGGAVAAPTDASENSTPIRPPLSLVPRASAMPASQTHAVANLQGDTAVIPVEAGTVRVWQLGIILNAAEQQIGRLVVTNVADGFVLATVTDGKGRVQVGDRVRFQRGADDAGHSDNTRR